MPVDHEANPDPFADLRERMVNEQLAARGIKDAAVLRAFRTVPRHRFVSARMQKTAYADRALPTTDGQTISQPYIVGLMTQALEAQGAAKVLEIGTGSGYQTAILAELAERVYTVERVSSLAHIATLRLHELGYENVHATEGDGSLGWPDEAPFDRIIVTAAAPEAPAPLLDQLADGGRMVIPLGPQNGQELTLITRSGDDLRHTCLCSCIFVRLIGSAAWKR